MIPPKLLTFDGKKLQKLLARYNTALLLVDTFDKFKENELLNNHNRKLFNNLKKELKDTIIKLN